MCGVRDSAELAVTAFFVLYSRHEAMNRLQSSPARSPVASVWEAEAPPEAATSSFCADRERPWAHFLPLRPAVSSIFCEARGWWLSVGVLRNASRHADTLSVCVIEFNGWAQAHLDTIRTPSVH